MKKNCFKVFMVLLSVLFCFLAMPTFSVQNVLAEESQTEKYSLVPPNYNASPSETEEKYNIINDNLSPFTPFDFDKDKRMTGSSFRFNMDEFKRFQDAYVLVDRQTGIKKSGAMALSMWIYFDKVKLHGLSFVLELESGESLSFSMSQLELRDVVKRSDYDETTPYGWTKIMIPFAKFEGFDSISSELLPSPTKLVVSYYSLLEDTDVSSLLFFDVAIEKLEQSKSIETVKQSYTICKSYFFEKALIDGLCVGDSLTLPTEKNAIVYAWQGMRDLKNEALKTSTNLKWRVSIKDPSGKITQSSFGEKITFETEGNYTIFYRCYETKDDKSTVILSAYLSINANKLNAIYFDRASLKIKVNVLSKINVATSSKFTSVSDISFEYDENCLEIVKKSDGSVFVKAKKTGEFTLKAKVTGKRVTTDEKEYSTTLTIKAVKNSTKDDKLALKIFLWATLGCFILGFIISLVISLVKSRKLGVK